MLEKDFDVLLERRLELIRSVLKKKAEEYAGNSDRLHNFKRAAAILEESQQKALIGMWVKHLVSVLDMVEEAKDKIQNFSDDYIDEKIGDSINYLILLEATLKERKSE